ncbi:MAG: hypothetical protein ACI9V1_003020 [Spirosomataceae bacterium]|jgi:hypothetical protein
MRRILVILFIITCSQSRGQEVLWASEVIDFSSQQQDFNFPCAYEAIQVLGKPNTLPEKNELIKCAWLPGNREVEEFIIVGFVKAIPIKQIAIFQNYESAHIIKIVLTDQSGVQYNLAEREFIKMGLEEGVYRVVMELTTFDVKQIKVTIDNQRDTQIDAIAISASDEPIVAKINEPRLSKEIDLEVLSSKINSKKYSEIAPVLTADGKDMYLVRMSNKKRGDKKQNIWHSTKQQNGEWSKAVKLGEPLNDEDDNAVTAITRDGSEIYVLNHYNKFNESGKKSIGLSKSTYLNGNYSYPRPVMIENFQALPHKTIIDGLLRSGTYTEFSISNNQQVLLMGLKRGDTFGQRDLYVSFLNSDSSYSNPLNLGRRINTAEVEGSPFLADDKRTLYFMSKGHLGYGNGDLFMSKRLDDTWTNWSEPINLGRSINSANWDGYISVTKSGTAYLSSKKDSKVDANIYKCELPENLR